VHVARVPAALIARAPAGIAATVVLVLGLSIRHVTGGALAKDAGDALYATFAYFLVLLVRPALAPWRAGLVAVAFCWAVECAQLTPWPAELSRQSVVFRLALGSRFNIEDLLWYLVGAGVPAALTQVSLRVARSTSSARANQSSTGPNAGGAGQPLTVDKSAQ
jgi:hypothetical protein